LRIDRVDSFACPNDPADGDPANNIGGPCESPANCNGNYCLLEAANPDFRGGYCLGQSDVFASCDPTDAGSCATGSKCTYAGSGSLGALSYICFDACAVAGNNDLAHRTNCDCRDGYSCDPVNGICLPGCTTDEECCRIWNDIDGDTRVQDSELTPVDACRGSCDPASSRCAYDGAPGAAIGDPCLHENDCPANSRCLTENASKIPGGMCVRERCDLDGNQCDGGSGCNDLGYYLSPYWLCLRGCEVGSAPGDGGFRCEADQACWPAAFDPAPRDFPDADGYCWTGNWSPISVHNIYSPCTQAADCWSPDGLGDCLQADPGGPGYCVVHGCTHPDVAPSCAEGGGGSCLADVVGVDHCLKRCTPDVAQAEGGCPPGFGCWKIGTDFFCYFACASSADCGGSWTCDTISDGCEYGS
jgi:hypothetical protein